MSAFEQWPGFKTPPNDPSRDLKKPLHITPEPEQEDYEDGDYDDYWEDNTCPRCSGVGGDPMDDYCTPCDHCGGEGYEWWK